VVPCPALRTAFIRSLIASTSLLLQHPLSAQQTVRPYAMHDIRLGTPLTQLRQLRFLNDEEQDKLRLVCSTDPEGAHAIVLDTIRIGRPGAVRCALFERGADSSLKPGKIQIFGEATQPTLILYKGENDRDFRLAQIGATLQGDRFTQVVTLMRQTYGAPTNYEMTNIETSEGDVGNASWLWTNGVSSIRAELLGLDLDHMSVTFSYDALMNEIELQDKANATP
jgi:hypothetical protein